MKLDFTTDILRDFKLPDLRVLSGAYRAMERVEKDEEVKKRYIEQRKEVEQEIKDRVGEGVERTPLGDDIKEFNPCLDFVDEVCYVSIPRTYKSEIPTKRGKGTQLRVVYEELPFVVTSEREGFLLSEAEAENRKLYYRTVPSLMSKRWTDKAIKDFTSGKSPKIDPKDLFERTRERFDYYLDWPNDFYYDFFALYVTSTYFFPLFPHQPIIFLTGETGSGKSKAIDVIEQMAFNTIKSAHISDASIYRLVESNRPTLLLDESERLMYEEQNLMLINLLLASTGTGAKVYRMEKDTLGNQVPKAFETKSPKVVANIKGIKTEALLSRCIRFDFVPFKDETKGNRDPDANDKEMEKIRHDHYLLLLTRWKEIKKTFDTLPPVASLSGRPLKLWSPILTMAQFFENHGVVGLFQRTVDFATKAAEDYAREVGTESFAGKLLVSLKELSENKGEGEQFYPTSEIISVVGGKYDEQPDWLKPAYVSKRMRSLGFGTSTRKYITGGEGKEQVRGFALSKKQVDEICERFKFGTDNPELDLRG